MSAYAWKMRSCRCCYVLLLGDVAIVRFLLTCWSSWHCDYQRQASSLPTFFLAEHCSPTYTKTCKYMCSWRLVTIINDGCAIFVGLSIAAHTQPNLKMHVLLVAFDIRGH